MALTDLIKTLIDYIDLGKRVATTIPGIAIALALVLGFAEPPDFLKRNAAFDTQLKAADERAVSATERFQKAQSDSQQAQAQIDALKAKLKTEPAEGQQTLKNQLTALTAGKHAFDIEAEYQTSQLSFLTKERTRLSDRMSEHAAFDGAVKGLFTSILLFGLLGFAIGTVLDPVNKAFFLQSVPELGSNENATTVRKFVTGYSTLRKQHTEELPHSPQFYIGRGLITAAEYSDLEANYYRFTEISIGMVIPSLIIGIAVAYRYGQGIKGAAWTQANIAVIAFTLAFAAAAAFSFFHFGIKRYGVFHQRVADLIKGREQQHQDKKTNVAEAQILHLSKAVRRLDQVVRQLGGLA